ncbi:MAG: ABC transporter permease [Pyrinomonas methylaliphatogenes]|nr:ABC transporter permease [Pyrinomonas methylaliphatogenes]
MRGKLGPIIRREYLERVRNKLFIFMTFIGPLLLIGFALVPAFIFKLDAGEAKRVVVVDETGKLFARVRDELEHGRRDETRDDALHQEPRNVMRYRVIDAGALPPDEARRELNERVRKGEVDFYVVLPKDILTNGRAEIYGRNLSDVFSVEDIQRALNDAVIAQRMLDARIDPQLITRLSDRVHLNVTRVSERGEETDSGIGFFVAFITGFLIYMTIILHGQAVLSAVVEEKTTRIVEVLLSSVRAFDLMMGKLIGVSLVALTQYAVWGLALLLFSLYGVSALAASGIRFKLPSIAPSVVIYFFLFFIVGFFIYATLYALIGAMVTTTQEGGQIAMPVVFLLIIGFYLVFPIMRSPNSTFATLISLVPFFSPILMPVRLVTEAPPAWETLLSLLLSGACAVGLVWVAARVYRVGILMYGKRATIPEVWRWIRQP